MIGHSEQGRPILGVTLGYGPRRASLVAGAHADEPVGPETLRALIVEGLARRDWGAEDGGFEPLLEQFTFDIVPHANPDAEAATGRRPMGGKNAMISPRSAPFCGIGCASSPAATWSSAIP